MIILTSSPSYISHYITLHHHSLHDHPHITLTTSSPSLHHHPHIITLTSSPSLHHHPHYIITLITSSPSHHHPSHHHPHYIITCSSPTIHLHSEVISTSNGSKIYPSLVENAIKREIPFLSHVMVLGDQRHYLICLVTIKVSCIASPVLCV